VEIINKELVAIFGLVIAVAILGGAFVHVLWLYTFQFSDSEIMEDKLELLEEEKKSLQTKIQKFERDLEMQKSKIIVNEDTAGIHTEQEMSRAEIAQPITLIEGSYSGVLSEQNLIIKNNDVLQELWNELTTDVPLPEVNFRKSTIIGVFYGEKPDLCYGIHIDSVKQFADKEENINTVVYVTKTILLMTLFALKELHNHSILYKFHLKLVMYFSVKK